MPKITITPGSMTESRCTFTADRAIHDGEAAHFTCTEDATDVPLAQAILSVPGVEELELSGHSFTVFKREDQSWEEIEGPLGYAVTSALERGADAIVPPSEWDGAADDDAVFEIVQEIFEREVNPSVASHGGRIDLIDVQDMTVIVRMQGGCQGCGMASVTLRQGIEGTLKRAVPELRGIQDITDHSAGTDPYFAQKK